MFLPFEYDNVGTKVLTAHSVLTKEECEKIINYSKSLKNRLFKGQIENNTEDKTIRQSNIIWLAIEQDPELIWLFQKVLGLTKDVNSKEYKFDLYGLTESLQFTEYTKNKDHYNWHVDCAVGMPIRKLSLIIQLSDEKDYVGGDVEIKIDHTNQVISKEQGSISIFPSYVLHRVTPVTKGTRHSLVTWAGGPNFK